MHFAVVLEYSPQSGLLVPGLALDHPEWGNHLSEDVSLSGPSCRNTPGCLSWSGASKDPAHWSWSCSWLNRVRQS
jgi:hypothetical protein